MKKDEKKGLSLEQLKKTRKILSIIVVVIFFTCFVVIFIGNIVVNNKALIEKINLCTISVMFLVLTFWMFFVDRFLGDKIRDEKSNLKILEIKNRARKGGMKDVVVIKSNRIRNEILINNIEKFLLKGFIQGSETSLIVEIYLKNGKSLPCEIHEEKILSILNHKLKEEILDNVIEGITIENVEQNNMQVKIESKGCIVNERADDFNLDGWFELKK